LLADIARHEWMQLCEQDRSLTRPGLATIPSVTEYSRTSLWCGKLTQGRAADEAREFAEHPALLAQCRAGYPPLLFHKISLQEAEDTVLAKEVREAIQSAHRKIVGVVVNAVDDHLLKGEQLDMQWSRDQIKVLPALLHEAKAARRLVVLVSDHGHVLDLQATAREADGGERWRTVSSAPLDDELLLEGDRVLVSGRRLIAPWSERVRYGIKKNGYHGGVSPQEMVIPIVVLSSTDDVPEGWQEQPVATPAWWDETAQVVTRLEVPSKPSRPPAAGLLFDKKGDEERPVPTVTAAPDAGPAWIQRLLSSALFAEQKRLAGRGVPPDTTISRLLAALDARGGKMTAVATARTLAIPEVRLPGLLVHVERVLNIDGYQVLNRDETSATVELNRELLFKQFDLD
jgi:hypothetical protein